MSNRLLRARRQPIKRAVFFAKIVKIRPYSHRLTSCVLDEIVGHEFAAVLINMVAQPRVQRPKLAGGDFLRDVGMRLQRGRITAPKILPIV